VTANAESKYKKYPNTQDLMYITDVMDQEKVTKYGSKDPWVVLPYTGNEKRNKPRTQAYDFKYLSYFYWNTEKCQFAHPEVTGMYYEPVIFARMMKLDNSKKIEELDGFSVVYQTNGDQQPSLDGACLPSYIDAVDAVYVDGVLKQIFE